MLGAITDEGADPWVHAVRPAFPLGWSAVPGRGAVSVDLDQLDPAGHDVLAEALEAGEWVLLGVVPSTDPAPSTGPTPAR